MKNAILLLKHNFYEKMQFLFQSELQGTYFLSSQQPKQRPPGLILTVIAPGALAVVFFPVGRRSRMGARYSTAQMTASFSVCALVLAPTSHITSSELDVEDSSASRIYLPG